MLITADQIRAARALKNWSQTDLAERTGLAVPTIANIELGKQMPGKNTIEKIIDAFAIGGIAFTANGVEFDRKEIYSLVGLGKFKHLLEDAIRKLQELPPKQREFLVFSADHSRTSEEEIDLYQEMENQGIANKSIVSNKGSLLDDVPQQLKFIDKKYFDERGAVFVFADTVAFYTAKDEENPPVTLIITNDRIAETYRKMFHFMWESLDEPAITKSSKKARK
jgi:transcriptional regulator with XRE-family HTH domain